ncbi:MAG: carbohydrate binding domain-containing protein [Phycisphaerae bacterium]
MVVAAGTARVWVITAAVTSCLVWVWPAPAQSTQGAPAKNLLANGSFELGREFWQISKAGKTAVKFEVSNDQAADGASSALLTIDDAESWGVQFGQMISPGAKGKTYTFAAVARSAGEPVKVALQIERNADPWDKVASTERATLTKDQWTELHVTFTVAKDYKEQWFAYIICTQPKCQFRVDMARLYEGQYVPYKDIKGQEVAGAGVVLYDTGAASAEAIRGEAFADGGRKAGWTRVAEDKTDHAFKGDAVMVNNRLAAVLRQKGGGVELYSVGDKDAPAVRRAAMLPFASESGGGMKFASAKIAENNSGIVALDATFTAGDGKKQTIRFELKMGQPYIGAFADEGQTSLRVEAPCRFAVMPDFFADDIVIDARELPAAKAELPSENFLLHLLDGGSAIVMAVWADRDRDITVSTSGDGEAKQIASSEIPLSSKDKKGKAWVALLDGPGMWHTKDIAKADAGKVMPLDWRPPMPAQWRMDWRREYQGLLNGLTDSWEMIVQQAGGDFVKHGLFGGPQTVPADRKRWTTVLGTFLYPCWIDKDGQGQIQVLKSNAVKFGGPAVIYPISRAPNTPLDAFTVVDVIRSTLGVGPCEYVLDVEGQQQVNKGRATCGNRDTLNPIYERKQQKARRADIELSLTQTLVFIKYIRARIEGYVALAHDIQGYLAEQRKAHPDLDKPIAELEALAAMPDAKVAARKDKIKTPEEAAAMMDAFRKDGLDYEGPDALDKCKKFTAAIVDIGGNQDELVGECRWAIKVLRQQAGLMMAVEPKMAEIAREIRARTQRALRNPAGHEGARH